jgi:hypothetical protein
MSENPNRIRLREVAHSRSGDKGNHANVAVIAYTAAGYEFLQRQLTTEVIERFFQELKPSRVDRFLAPNVLGLNFLLYDALAGGASRSLRIDTQGKSLGEAVLELELPAPTDLAQMRRPVAVPSA